jgi:hypothetical protein
VTDADSRPTPTDSAQVGEAPDLGRLVNPAPAGTVVGPGGSTAGGAGAAAAAAGSGAPAGPAGSVANGQPAALVNGHGSESGQVPAPGAGPTIHLQPVASGQTTGPSAAADAAPGTPSGISDTSGTRSTGGQDAPAQGAPAQDAPGQATPPAPSSSPAPPNDPFAPPQDAPPPPPAWGAPPQQGPPTPPPSWGTPPRQPYGQVRPGPVQPWGAERPREPERPVTPWQDPNRYGPVRPGADQRPDDPDRRYRDQREVRQPQRRERDMPTRWALGLSLGATACTLLALYQGPATFPAWMVGAGAGLVLAIAAFVLAIRAQRTASMRHQRASEATASLVSACVSGTLAGLLLVTSIVWFGPLTDYAKCMQGANTQSAQDQCIKQLEHQTGMAPQ